MRRLLPYLLCVALGFAVGQLRPLHAAVRPNLDSLYAGLEVLAQVIAVVEENFVDPLPAKEIIYGAARGAMSVLDEHSAFFDPEEFHELQDDTEGEYAGIGIEVDWNQSLPVVVTVLNNSPAKAAGLKKGDILSAIDGKSLENANIEEVYKELRGPAGTQVKVSVLRPEREVPWEFTLTRSWIRLEPLTHSFRDGVLYVHISSFARRVSFDLQALIQARRPKGVILDLRDNPGGLFDEAVAICDLFVSDGEIVHTVGRNGVVMETFEAKKSGKEFKAALAILLNSGSASASEVVAAVLRERRAARLFGTKSYGKGSIQNVIDLVDGSGMKVTIARYITPAGTKIDGVGLTPDVTIDLPEVHEDDAVVQAARGWLKNPDKTQR